MDMRFIAAWLGVVLSLCSWSSSAQEALCAEVKIEIMQELTMERQGFEALMRITNSLDTFSLEDVSVKVLFTDADGNPVIATSNTAASNAAFFIRVDDTRDVTGLQNGADGFIQGGSIAPKKIGELRWLIIPTANAAGQTKDGKLFFVGAELKYSYGGKEEVVNVAADSIVVKPQPALTLDYFLTEEVVGDNGFTPEIEPAEPYTLGVRISNNGFGFARSVKIESAQPRIVENKLGLAVNFKILGSYLKDQPAAPTLLINFGNIEPKGVTAGRWIMESNLAGKFIAFNASFTHADELGGELTSLLQATNANFLVRDVLMDLSGRDSLRDFLAYSATRELYVYESEPTGLNEVTCTNCKKVTAVENAVITHEDSSRSHFDFEPVGGLTYARGTDPFNGNKVLAKVVRENGSVVHPQNAWLSKKRAADNINFEYFVNIFDNNSSGSYTLYWGGNLVDLPQPPVIQFMQDVVTFEGGNIGFLVRATDPNNTLPTINPLQLPAGASFNPSAVNQGVFNWTPAIGQAGNYVVTFTATDGELTAERSVNIIVHPANDTDGDGMDDDWEREKFGNLDKDGTEDTDGDGRTDLQEFEDGTDPNLIEAMPAAPQILAPIFDADTLDGELFPLQPELVVSNGDHPANVDAVAIVFEVYKDEALTELMGTATINEGEGAETPGDGTTHWKISPVDLIEGFAFEDNALYYWRAKSIQTISGNASSEWIKSRFFINTVNDAPTAPHISSPAVDASIPELSPTLSITNSTDVDRDELRYAFVLYEESDLATPVATVSGLLAGNNGQTNWFVAKVLEEDKRYTWQATVTDEHGVTAQSEWGSFLVNVQNNAPTDPVIDSPAPASTISELQADNSVLLRVINSSDPERQTVTYYFELDKTNTFDSPDKQTSPAISAGESHTQWKVTGLTDDTHYFWRVKANDGEVDSAWVAGDFTLSIANQPPSVPVLQNPVGGVLVPSQYVVLEGNPAHDPEGTIVKYHIELYTDAALTQRIFNEVTLAPMWQLDPILVDQTTYYWRMRAEDNDGQFSAWSEVGIFTINLPRVNVKPHIELLAPAAPVVLRDGILTIQWNDSDPDSDARIRILATLKSTGVHAPIVVASDISEDFDGDGDIYELDVSNLPVGIYIISVEIADEETRVSSASCCTLEVLPPLGALIPNSSHWLFNENTGDITASQVGSFTSTLSVSDVNPGSTAETKPVWVAGRNSGAALSFDGIGGYLKLEKPITDPLLNDASLSFWVKTTLNPASAPAIIASHISAGNPGNSIKWGSIGLQGQIGLAVGDTQVLGLTKINDGQWHQVVITRKKVPGSANGIVKVYVDGNLDAYAEPKDSRFTGLFNSLLGLGVSNNVLINPNETNYVGTGTKFFKGILDDVRIYSRPLTTPDIHGLYHAESGKWPSYNGSYEVFANTDIYQAENASIFFGVVGTNRAGYMGLGFVDYYGLNSYVEWVVDNDHDEAVILEFTYSNGGAIDRPLAISVNGGVVNSTLSFPVTPDWTTWVKSSTSANLIRGRNVIRAYVAPNSPANDGPNMDYLTIKRAVGNP
jgi:hypothetical protein